MDCINFSEENFDPCVWINNLFKMEPNKEGQISSQLFELQQTIQERNLLMEDSCCKLLYTISKILKDINTLNLENNFLADRLNINQTSIKQKDDANSNLINSLEDMDKMRNRLRDVNCAILEAQNWNGLVYESEKAIAFALTQDNQEPLQNALDYVKRTQNSFQILSCFPEHESKLEKLRTLQEDLENCISTILITNLNKKLNTTTKDVDLNDINSLISMYSEIDLRDQAIQYCEKCFVIWINNRWISMMINNSAKKNNSPDDRIVAFVNSLNEYYIDLSENWTKLLTWNQQLFPDCYVQVSNRVVISCLSKMSPTFANFLDCTIPSTPFETFDPIKRSMDTFIMTNLTKVDAIPNIHDTLKFLDALYYPLYKVLVPSYLSMQKNLFNKTLSQIMIENSSTQSNDLACLLKKFQDAFTILVGEFAVAIDICALLVNGTLFPELLVLVKLTLSTFLEFNLASIKNKIIQINLQPWQTALDPLMKICHFLGLLIVEFSTHFQQKELLIPSKFKAFKLYSSLNILHNSEQLLSIDPLSLKLLVQLLTPILKTHDFVLDTPLNNYFDPEKIGRLKLWWEDLYSHNQAMTIAYEEAFRPLCIFSIKALKSTLSEPIQTHLRNVHTQNLWFSDQHTLTKLRDGDAPALHMAYIPSEYITEIGQYLLLLPQYLESYSFENDSPYKIAFEYFGSHLANGTDEINTDPHIITGTSKYDNAAEYWLQYLIDYTCQALVKDVLLKINRLNTNGCHQLICDIAHF
ncbi:uncharacterized protein LOC135931175 isoform X2 [Gordionus sp. m RMFG-2023]|uniref:uncharacterized protein LOC135931175 isoform X2 n=1 Tax=Gordionus sp. m RMFG-2023 TaxID=3053472 RepID=UPI0031FC3BBD